MAYLCKWLYRFSWWKSESFSRRWSRSSQGHTAHRSVRKVGRGWFQSQWVFAWWWGWARNNKTMNRRTFPDWEWKKFQCRAHLLDVWWCYNPHRFCCIPKTISWSCPGACTMFHWWQELHSKSVWWIFHFASGFPWGVSSRWCLRLRSLLFSQSRRSIILLRRCWPWCRISPKHCRVCIPAFLFCSYTNWFWQGLGLATPIDWGHFQSQINSPWMTEFCCLWVHSDSLRFWLSMAQTLIWGANWYWFRVRRWHLISS